MTMRAVYGSCMYDVRAGNDRFSRLHPTVVLNQTRIAAMIRSYEQLRGSQAPSIKCMYRCMAWE